MSSLITRVVTSLTANPPAVRRRRERNTNSLQWRYGWREVLRLNQGMAGVLKIEVAESADQLKEMLQKQPDVTRGSNGQLTGRSN